jgi:RNA polymerase sigma factor (sigma-70 family)
VIPTVTDPQPAGADALPKLDYKRHKGRPENAPLVPQETVIRAIQGDEAALRQVFEVLHPRLISFCLRRLRGDEVGAADVVATAWRKMLSDLPRRPHDLKLASWAHTITQNALFDHLKSGARRQEISLEAMVESRAARFTNQEDDGDTLDDVLSGTRPVGMAESSAAADPADLLIETEEAEARRGLAHRVLASLSKEDREVLLAYAQGERTRDIGEVLVGCEDGPERAERVGSLAVGRAIRHAQKAVRELLAAEGDARR